MKYFKIYIALFLVVNVSCSNDIDIANGIWIGYQKEADTYFEMWFSKDKMIILDLERGLYKAFYTIDKGLLNLNNTVFPINSFSIEKINADELYLVANENSRYHIIRIKVPYFIDPFNLNISLEVASDEYPKFWEEGSSRRDFFIRYLQNDSIETHYDYGLHE